MKKAKSMLAVMGCAAMLLGGCTQSNIVTVSYTHLKRSGRKDHRMV